MTTEFRTGDILSLPADGDENWRVMFLGPHLPGRVLIISLNQPTFEQDGFYDAGNSFEWYGDLGGWVRVDHVD